MQDPEGLGDLSRGWGFVGETLATHGPLSSSFLGLPCRILTTWSTLPWECFDSKVMEVLRVRGLGFRV